MSTKSTIWLSDANEHFYYDCSDDSFTLEFELDHLLIEGTLCSLEIKKGTALHAAIKEGGFNGKTI